MAGNANDMRAPWPYGGDALYCLQSHTVNMIASQAARAWDTITLPFAVQIKRAEWTTYDVSVSTNTIAVTLVDDASSPNTIINAEAIAAITAGDQVAPVLLTVDKPNTTIYAGANLIFKYTTGSGDTTSDSGIRLWVKIIH